MMRSINGSGKTIPPFIALFVSLYVLQVPLAVYLSSLIGAEGIWWAIAIGMSAQGILIIPYFFSMKWAKTGE